jgi:tetratricopeptide (TPR) repeat protein
VTTYSVYPSGTPLSQPIVVTPQITINVNGVGAPPQLRDEDFPDKIIIRPGQKTARGAKVPPADAPPAGEKLAAPEMRKAEPPPAGEKLAPPEIRKPEPPAPAEPLPPGEFWIPDRPVPRPANPNAPEHERLLSLGKMAFADGEYARAERRFQQAVAVAPKEAMSHFFLAQVQFALGKYPEAVASIHAGLRLRPTWPTSGFRGRALYGLNIDDYVEHLKLLQEALARQPNDPVLLFLYAYQLWFDGRQNEARPIFLRVRPLVAEPRFIQLFLQGQQAGPVVLN